MKRIKDKFSRTLAMLLAVIMLVGMLPVTAFATGTQEDVVYLSISFDSHYIDDKNGNPIAYVPVPMSEIEAIDLTEYGLDNMLYDVDGDGAYETTALQLLIYAHEELYGGDWGEVNFDALPGSSYFKGGIFGFTENLVYFHNGDFPVDQSQQSDYMTVGATSDRIVLEAGDFLDVASFECFAFLWDMLGGFHLFADEEGNYTHDYAANAGEALSVKLKHSFCDLMYGIAWVKDAEYFEVYYGTTFGEAEGSVTTDESGNAQITFPTAGTYYIWCDGGMGSDDGTHTSCTDPETNDPFNGYDEDGNALPCIVSSPAFAKVTVTGGESSGSDSGNEDQKAADKVIALINAIGTVTLDSEQAIKDAREAYDLLGTNEKKALVTNYKTLTDAETDLARLKQEAEDKAAADAVIALINGIGTVGLASEGKIKEVRAAYNQLTDAQKLLVDDDYNTLLLAEANLAQLKDKSAADGVFAKIAGIGEVTLASEQAIEAARVAYEVLTDTQKLLVDNIAVLEAAEKALADLKAADIVIKMIKAIGEVTLEKEDEINAAGIAYNALSEEQKVLVTNYKDWSDAFDKLTQLKDDAAQAAEDRAAADAVIAKINAIGEVKLASEQAIKDARKDFDALTKAQLVLVGNANVLDDAEETLQALKDAVADVVALIGAIGEVKLASADAIIAARTAYDALTAEQKAAVTNAATLEAAEATLLQLNAAVTDVIAKINAIGTVTLDSEDAVTAACTAYAALTTEQKALVTNYEALTVAENSLKDFASVSTVLNDTMKKLANTVKEPAFGTNAGEWTVFSLARGGYFNADNKYFTDYYHRIAATVNKVAEEVNMNGALDKNKSTDNARLMVALSAIGRDATFVGGWDLVEAYAKNGINWIRKQGLNGTIWALIALDSNNYETPDDATIRQQCVDAILAAQHDDNGWSLITAKAQTSNVDITGMALVALYPYRDQPEVAEACEKAIAWMSESQLDNGGFPYGLGETSESCAWAIVAATTWGINPDTDSRFIKNGKSAVDNLLTYYVAADKMFAHQGTTSNPMATDQACYALVAYSRFMNGEKALFDYSDVTFKETTKVEAVEDLIDAIGTVTVDSGDIIDAARYAYSTLTKDEKDLVSNYDDLEDAEEAYEDFAAAKTVIDLIAAIGKVTTGSEAKILKARNAYEKLTPAQKKLVSNYDDLEDAEEELEEAKVEYVEDLIASIGTVTKDSKQKIDRARSAYNGLSASNKKAVRNLSVLLAAEEAYKKLGEEPTDKKTSETVKDLTVIAGKVDKQIESITEESTTGEILDILFAYETLTEGEKAAIGKTNTVAFLKQQVAQEIQTDAKTGIGVSGVDWHIRIAVEDPMDIAKVQSLQETLGKNTMLGLWDIHLEDIQQSAEIQPDGTVLVKIPLALLSDFTAFDGLAVVHYADDGTVEYLNSTMIGDCIAFNAVEFSYYAVVGYMGASPLDGMMSDEADGAAVTPWIIIGCCAVVLLGAAVYLGSKNRRQKAGEQIG